jgi:hypothetical protein
MYRIEYYTSRGGFVYPTRFRTWLEAHRHARKRFDRSTVIHYVVLTDLED